MNSETLHTLLMECEHAYKGFQTGSSNLQRLYHWLCLAVEEYEHLRLEQAQAVKKVHVLSRYDLYETTTAVAYALGHVREAFDYSERARVRSLLDRTLNKSALHSRKLQDSLLLKRGKHSVNRLRTRKSVSQTAEKPWFCNCQSNAATG